MRSEEKVFSKMKKTSLPNLFFYSKKRIEIRIFSKEKKKSLNFFFFFFLMFETDIQQIFFYSGLIIFKNFFFHIWNIVTKTIILGKKFSLFFMFETEVQNIFQKKKKTSREEFLKLSEKKIQENLFCEIQENFIFYFWKCI